MSHECRTHCTLKTGRTSPPGAAFSVMAEEDYILIGIAIASTLCLVASYGL
jgi:lipoprotein signal peptidase